MPQHVVIFLGPQGCGKGTQLKLLADFLKQKDSRPVLAPAMGNMLRDFAQGNSHSAALLRPILARGDLVEYAVSVPLFGNYLLQNLQGDEHVLIDGFPRSLEQVEFLDSAARFYNWQNATVVRIEISDDESLKRLALRKRADDTPEGIRSRLAWTREAEKRIQDWFVAHPTYRFVEIDGMGTIEETQIKVRSALDLA